MANATLTRRGTLGAIGALVVSIGLPLGEQVLAAVARSPGRPPLTPDQLDSYLAIHADGRISAFFGKMDFGHGLHSGIAQIVAEELDASFQSVTVFMGDTDTSVNQGGGSGSCGVALGGRQMRAAAAEARRLLVEMAARRFGTAPANISVTDGICRGAGSEVSYADLIGGRFFNVALQWNGQMGNVLYAPGPADPKDPKDYTLVGKSLPRGDVAWKVFGTGDYVTDIKVPGMWHARVVRPPVPGAGVRFVDESALADIPEAKVIRQGNFLAVIAPKEWNAIRAATTLAVEWEDTQPPLLAMDTLYDHLRTAPARKRDSDKTNTGDTATAFASAARVIEAEYEWPFQSHASMAGACTVAQFTDDGHLHVWSGSQKPHFNRIGLARFLDLPEEQVHVKWVIGPGSYGRNDCDDCVHEAALLARLSGRPIRLQYMRHEGTAWDPKGPASVHHARAALDTSGNVIALEFTSRGFSRTDTLYSALEPGDTLLGQTLLAPLRSADDFGHPQNSYGFPARQHVWETIAPIMERGSPLRTAHLRDPVGPQIHFAMESFMDEIAAAKGVDPVAFRLSHVRDPRDRDVIRRAAETFGWEARPSPRPAQGGSTLTGRGIAYAQREGTRVAVVAEVSIDSETHAIKVTRMAAAHDCGQILNPRSLKTVVEGNLISGISRAMKEEVAFDAREVTSVDWATYPVVEMADVPARIDVVLIDRPGEPMTGAGEPAIRPVAAAIANAIFDATGVRLRRAPLTAERYHAAAGIA